MPPLITLLSTDIEGSTSFVEQAREEYQAALSQHRAIIRGAVRAYFGEEFHEAGDGFFIAFENPSDAVACAVAIQHQLATAQWPEQFGAPKVRMALHRGEAEFREGQYRGLALNKTARILSAAHGGQIICSAALADALLPGDGFALSDLGAYKLRGLREPERLFQIGHAAMPRTDFPPPRANPANQHNLPSTLTQFFGRETEIARLTELLDVSAKQERLITLTGPGGTGKTRLSIAVAERLLETYSHAVTFVPLAELTDPRLLPEIARDALKLPPSPDRPPLAQIIAHLQTQPWLLVLDNFEQLATEGGDFLLSLLCAAPSLHCLVSSRQRLAIPGEREFPVSPLPLPDERGSLDQWRENESVQLFANRAQAVRGDFALTQKNTSSVVSICRTLEGIPLAIELAAARAQILTPREIHEQIREHFSTLADESADRPERHRTLHAAIDWSYSALPPDLRFSFAQLAVFRGGCTAQAAATVTDLPLHTVLHHLLQLRVASLIFAEESDEEMRYRMLETIRQYAEEKLVAQAAEIRQRHAQFFTKLVRTGKQSSNQQQQNQTQWIKRLDAEADNLRAALVFMRERNETNYFYAANALYDYWIHRGLAAEGAQWLSAAMESPCDDLMHAGSLGNCGALFGVCGRLEESKAYLEKALAYFRANGPRENEAGLLTNLATIAKEQGDFDGAMERYEESLAIYDTLNLEFMKHAVLGNMGVASIHRGDFETAECYLQKASEYWEKTGDTAQHLSTLEDQTFLSLAKNELLQCLQHLQTGLAQVAETGILSSLSAFLDDAALLLSKLGFTREAVGFLAAAEKQRSENGMAQIPSRKAMMETARESATRALSEADHTAAWQSGLALNIPEMLQILHEEALQQAVTRTKNNP